MYLGFNEYVSMLLIPLWTIITVTMMVMMGGDDDEEDV